MSFSAVQLTHSRLFALSSLVLLLLAFFSFPSEAQGQNQAKELAQAQGQERAQAQGRSQVQRSTRQAAPGRAPRLLTVEQYSRLTSEQRQNYIGALQDLYIKVESQQMHRGRPMRYSAVDQNGEFHSDAGVNGAWPVGSEMFTSFWAQVLGAPAWAQTEAEAMDRCIVGGVVRRLDARGRCPTFGRPCGEGDGFKCGVIFGNACVNRLPLEGLTQRCKANPKELTPENYRAYITDDYRQWVQLVAGVNPTSQPAQLVWNEVQQIVNHFNLNPSEPYQGRTSSAENAPVISAPPPPHWLIRICRREPPVVKPWRLEFTSKIQRPFHSTGFQHLVPIQLYFTRVTKDLPSAVKKASGQGD